MTTTTTPTDLVLTKWRQNYWLEYVRESGFKPYMGAGSEGITSVIHTAMELKPKGKTLTIPLVGRLTSSGVVGNTRLSGAEESLGKHSHSVTIQYRRNAIEFSAQDEHYDASSARDAARPLLKQWSTEKLRDDIIDAMHSPTFSGATTKTFGTPLNTWNTAASTAETDTWRAANTDRALFGALIANNATDFATSLATIDNSADKFTAAAIGVMKRLAKTCDPHIRPIRTSMEDGREYYVIFTHPILFRDLKADSTIVANNRDARAREGNGMDKNPLFQDGDLMHDGCIIREIPEFPTLSSTINVGMAVLCGAQAVCAAWGQEPRPTEKKETDYDFFTGAGIEEMIGVNKVMRKHGVAGTFKDNGTVSGFFAAVGDA
jgi:N4-gp56 family major capsid protein